jgi:hypothetical protein
MKVREVLKLKERYSPGGARSVAADRTRTILARVQASNPIVRPRQLLASQDFVADEDPNHGVTGELPPALDLTPAILAPISTPQTRELDFIKGQLARLPRHTEQ